MLNSKIKHVNKQHSNIIETVNLIDQTGATYRNIRRI